jgi:hypothetical protein
LSFKISAAVGPAFRVEGVAAVHDLNAGLGRWGLVEGFQDLEMVPA